jgi:hypothetical protein
LNHKLWQDYKESYFHKMKIYKKWWMAMIYRNGQRWAIKTFWETNFNYTFFLR